MKKIVLLLLAFLLSGCTITRIDTDNIGDTIDTVLAKDNNLFNQVGKGYKYYIPRGVSYVDTTDYNDILYSNGDYYYLYIDAISYYYNVEFEYTVNEKAYYSKDININGKHGYIEINKQDDRYFVEFMYNYAKVEALVDEKGIGDVILNASNILSTIQFNESVISLMLNDEFLVGEEKYDIFTSKQETDDFLKLEEGDGEWV